MSLYTNIPHDLGLTAIEYYIDKSYDLLPNRFTKSFILESIKFILQNNNFIFQDIMFNQLTGTAMGDNIAPPYAILSIGYLEETQLYPQVQREFNMEDSLYIENNFLRYIDDGFILLKSTIDIYVLTNILNNLHPMIKFTVEPGKQTTDQQEINFLDIMVILNRNGTIETDIYYKETNCHDYLNYHSHHPIHIKNNIPYNLAKRIIVFVSNHNRMKFRLNQMRQWLIKCGYPDKIIDKGFHNAALQGPAPNPEEQKENISFVSNYYSNYNNYKLCSTKYTKY